MLLAFAISDDWNMIVWTGATIAVLEFITAYIIEPRVYGESTGLTPLAIVLAAIFYGLHQAFGNRGYFGASSEWLAYINLILALFNLLPGYPLDGGRILESIVWGLSGKQETGVRVAGTAGQIIA